MSMGWNRSVDLNCERTGPDRHAEPLNAVVPANLGAGPARLGGSLSPPRRGARDRGAA